MSKTGAAALHRQWKLHTVLMVNLNYFAAMGKPNLESNWAMAFAAFCLFGRAQNWLQFVSTIQNALVARISRCLFRQKLLKNWY